MIGFEHLVFMFLTGIVVGASSLAVVSIYSYEKKYKGGKNNGK